MNLFSSKSRTSSTTSTISVTSATNTTANAVKPEAVVDGNVGSLGYAAPVLNGNGAVPSPDLDKVAILDAGSQFGKVSAVGECALGERSATQTSSLVGRILDDVSSCGLLQVIDRRVRELNVYTEMLPLETPVAELLKRNFKYVSLIDVSESLHSRSFDWLIDWLIDWMNEPFAVE